MSNKIIHINNLMKKYGQREVVSDVSMTLNKGEIIGLLGLAGETRSMKRARPPWADLLLDERMS